MQPITIRQASCAAATIKHVKIQQGIGIKHDGINLEVGLLVSTENNDQSAVYCSGKLSFTKTRPATSEAFVLISFLITFP